MTGAVVDNNFNGDDLKNAREVQFENLIAKRDLTIQAVGLNKGQANVITRKIPIQVLAAEWFSRIDSSTENRTYLMENFLPVLVLGCEKVLNEAQNKQLVAQNKKDPNFNPINFLAQFLMRNNPKLSNHNESNQFVRTMREVFQELKEQMNAIQGNKLSILKEDVRRRRHERERQERLRVLEIARRRKQLEESFKRFSLTLTGRLELDLIFSSFRLYEEQILNLPEDLRKSAQLKLTNLPLFIYVREDIMLEKRLLLNEFTDCILNVTEHMKSDLFNLFNEFFEECAVYYVYLANASNLYRILKDLIKLIDTTQTGFLSRRRLLRIFEEFREKRAKSTLRNPFDWPVLDTFIKFENKLEEVLPPLELVKENTKLTLDGFQAADHASGDSGDKQSTSGASINESGSAVLQAVSSIKDKSEFTSGKPSLNPDQSEQGDDETKASAVVHKESLESIKSDESKSAARLASASSAAVAGPTESVSDEKSVGEKTAIELDTSRMEPLADSLANTSRRQHEKSVVINLNNVLRPPITKKDELMFLKGGSLYYTPLSNSLNAFDKTLLADLAEAASSSTLQPSSPTSQTSSSMIGGTPEQHQQRAQQQRVPPANLLTDFDPEFLTPRQVLNLTNNFISQHFVNSEIHVNDLVVFIKDNYAETALEKSAKLEKLSEAKKKLARTARFTATFEKLDNECSGQMNFLNLVDALVNFKDGVFKEQVLNVSDSISQKIIFSDKPDEFINKDEFLDFVSTLINVCEFPRFEDQLSSYLNGMLNPNYVEKTRGELRRTWLNQMEYVGQIVCGSFEPLFKQLFLTLLKDAENHNQSKNISAYVGILERASSDGADTSGLRYHASTPHDSHFVLGKTLTRNSKNISFSVIDNGKFEHVPKVRAASNIHFFNNNNKNDGSLVIYPLRYARNKIFGTLGIDTLQEVSKNNTFNDNELKFYQGVANTFANAYANVIFKNRLLKCCISAVNWLNKRCTGIDFVNIYHVQLLDNQANINEDILPKSQTPSQLGGDGKAEAFSLNLKPIMKFKLGGEDGGAVVDLLQNKPEQTKLENKLGSKAYECALISETTIEYFNGKASYYVPLRNEDHKTMFVFEISSKSYFENAEKYEDDFEQIETVLYTLHKCQEELLEERFLGLVKNRFEFEALYDQDKFEILFEKTYLSQVVCPFLDTFANQELIELMPDGSRSIETSQSKNLVKLVADLVLNDELAKTHVLNENALNALKALDPTVGGFKFNASTSSYKIQNGPEILDELHSFYKSLTKINKSLRLFVDWVCLMKAVKLKSSEIAKH